MIENYAWGHQRRFNSYPEYFKKLFGSRVQKVTIDAGFTCPNRDGTLGTGGCTYCNNEAFSPSYCIATKSITRQIEEGILFHRKRYKAADKFLGYFQAYSNTYGSYDEVVKRYEEALSIPGIAGLVIGTRPDSISDRILDYLQELSKKVYVIVEYGIESCYNKTLARINRGHTFEQSVDAIKRTAAKGIRTGGHMIFGLPGETRQEMLKEAEILSALPLNTVKFHQLQLIKGTKLAIDYQKNPSEFSLFTPETYLNFCVDFIELLSPTIVIERIAGEAPPRFILDNFWGIRYDQILNLFEKKLEKKDTWQGKKHG